MPDPRLIYLLDDDADYRFLVQQVFTIFLPECRVRFFPDGAAFIASIESAHSQSEIFPRVIVLDIDMPELNGFQTLERLKHIACWQNIPVVMMTNRDHDESRWESFRLGANCYVLKPMSLLDIKSVMTSLCEHEGDFTTLFAGN